jgi:hypothetical protein
MKKKHHIAFWVASSFHAVEFTKYGLIKGYFLGAHKPRDYIKIPLFNNEPRIEDLKPKGNLCILDNGVVESFMFMIEDMPRLLSAINVLTKERDMLGEAEIIAHRTNSELLDVGRTNYIEKNFHDIKESTVLQNVNNLYKYNERDPKYRLQDICWIKNSLISHGRISTDKNNNIIGTVYQCLVAGFDIRYRMPLIGLKKSYDDYFNIIPLVDNGAHLINAFVYTIYYKPPTRYIIPSVYENAITKFNLMFQNYELVQCDISNTTFNEFITKINDE